MRRKYPNRPTRAQVRLAMAAQAPLDREIAQPAKPKRRKLGLWDADGLDGLGGTDGTQEPKK